ncbi:MAG: adenine phosphoribosyltransferase [Acidimicrobiales bacterium]|nr:adenine phosphoribosyltransferase [Acidimicrobiales bacterium]
MSPEVTAELASHIRDIADFPEPGVVFKDITPLLANGPALRSSVEALAAPFADAGVSKVLGVEARGFILAAPVAATLGVGFVPVRKPGKLPWQVEHQEYELEYGTDRLEIHRDAVAPGERVLIVDDVMATGGTAAATAALVERLGGDVVGLSFLIELAFLNGRQLLPGHEIATVITY